MAIQCQSSILIIKRLIRDYWCLKIPVSMYVMSQMHDTMIIAVQCDCLCTNCQFLKTGLVDHIDVLQTPMKLSVATFSRSDRAVISTQNVESSGLYFSYRTNCGCILLSVESSKLGYLFAKGTHLDCSNMSNQV